MRDPLFYWIEGVRKDLFPSLVISFPAELKKPLLPFLKVLGLFLGLELNSFKYPEENL
jgi:hypothetical protein